MNELLKKITTNPAVADGLPCIRDTRITVRQIERLLKSSTTVSEILTAYPSLRESDIDAVRVYMNSSVKITPQQPLVFNIDDMRKAYEVSSEKPFEEWIDVFLKGEEAVKEIKEEQLPIVEKISDQNNLPE